MVKANRVSANLIDFFLVVVVTLRMRTSARVADQGTWRSLAQMESRLSEEQAQKLQQGIEAISSVFSTRSGQEDVPSSHLSVSQGSSAGE